VIDAGVVDGQPRAFESFLIAFLGCVLAAGLLTAGIELRSPCCTIDPRKTLSEKC
jgi:hypothetical protein